MRMTSKSLRTRRQRVAQLELAPHRHGEQPNFGRGEILIGRHQHEAAVLDRDQGLDGAAIAQQHIAAGARLRMLVDAASHGGIALRIQIDEQHAALGRRQRRGEIHRGRGLAHAAFLIGHCNDAFHVRSAFWLRLASNQLHEMPFIGEARHPQAMHRQHAKRSRQRGYLIIRPFPLHRQQPSAGRAQMAGIGHEIGQRG